MSVTSSPADTLTGLVVAVLIAALPSTLLAAQLTTATLSGTVTDDTGAVLAGALVSIRSQLGAVRVLTTGESGTFTVSGLAPSSYSVQVARAGFQSLDVPAVLLSVGDRTVLTLRLSLAGIAERAVVTAPERRDASTGPSHLVDLHLLSTIPLNGRSLHTLVGLTPGVVFTPATFSSQGQFSVNGQRASANYVTIDGASGNVGISGGFGLTQTAAGALPALTVFGGTSGLISADAVQEFRVMTSSYAPESGRTPGAQLVLASRSGGNQVHGGLFDYWRHEALDANDWFANRAGQRKPAQRQQNAGGTLSGPVVRNRLLYFGSYERLRLRQPMAQRSVVPSLAARASAPEAVRPLLAAFPLPNGPDAGGELAEFTASFANPVALDAFSVRADAGSSAFVRYSSSESSSASRGFSGVLNVSNLLRTAMRSVTGGVTQTIGARTTHELRVNATHVENGSRVRADDFGGAQVPNDPLLFPAGLTSTESLFSLIVVPGVNFLRGANTINAQRQFNLVDTVTIVAKAHQLKLGVDYRRLTPSSRPLAYQRMLRFSGVTGDGGVLGAVAPTVTVAAFRGTTLRVHNLSAFAQDTVRLSPRATLTYGVRWEVNPAPRGLRSADDPAAVIGLGTPVALRLAPRGTPLYAITFGNVAPRVAAAYEIGLPRGRRLGLRAGAGTYFDLGAGSLGQVASAFPFVETVVLTDVPLPLGEAAAAVPTIRDVPPIGSIYVADPALALPRTFQWHATADYPILDHQTISISYVGAAGRRLLRQDTLRRPNPDFDTVFVTRNGGRSDYRALHVAFSQRVSRVVRAQASYSWAHATDLGSNDSATATTPTALGGAAVDYGDSDFDVRHAGTAAVTVAIPSPRRGVARALFGSWSMSGLFTARSAPPLTVFGATAIEGGAQFVRRADVVPGVPVYLTGADYPGGRVLNRAAFAAAPAGRQGTLQRNTLRGFPATQVDVGIERHIAIGRAGLQLRAEFFNVLNTPNFGSPVTSLSNPLFGEATQSLNQSLGAGGLSGGLSPLYQIGGPRSGQLAARLSF